jgi:hypothetical protein
MMRVVYTAILLMLFSFPAYAEDGGGFMFRTDPKVKRVAPKKPVTIKLKRMESGKYTWELKGDDADEILGVDKKLRERLGVGRK